jgi:hypothetical protein
MASGEFGEMVLGPVGKPPTGRKTTRVQVKKYLPRLRLARKKYPSKMENYGGVSLVSEAFMQVSLLQSH